jgi:Domain of unknown function (DUF4440)
VTGYEELRTLNVKIGNAETRGDKRFFEDLLAPAFAIRRAGGKRIETREQFISAVAKSARRTTEVQSISVFIANRALVACIVTMEMPEGPTRFHNLRLFTRSSPRSQWKLLAWANEPVE